MKKELLYSGKAKSVFATDVSDQYVIEYRNDLTAGNGLKKGSFAGKGAVNNDISAKIFEYLAQNGVQTHFVKQLGETESLVKVVKILPLEVIVRNYCAGSFVKRYGAEEGKKLAAPIFELSYKNDDFGDPLINNSHVIALELATAEQLADVEAQTLAINKLLQALFDKMDLILVDFKLEFGTLADGTIVLADEISPDTCRLWDKTTLRKLDKDRFRDDLGEYAEAYHEVQARLHKVL